jgi:hypothetical protein
VILHRISLSPGPGLFHHHSAEEDKDHHFYPVSFTLVHGEDSVAYEIGLTHLKSAIDEMLLAGDNVGRADWAPRYLMGDGAAAISNGAAKAFPPCGAQLRLALEL